MKKNTGQKEQTEVFSGCQFFILNYSRIRQTSNVVVTIKYKEIFQLKHD